MYMQWSICKKLIPHSQTSRVGVPDWHVAFFDLVDVTSQVLFSGSAIPIALPFFFFFLIRGKKCEESMSEAYSLLKISALKWHTYVHIALKRTQSQGQTPCQGGCKLEFWPFCLAVIVGETGVGRQQRLSGTVQSLCNPLCCNERLLVCSDKSLCTFFFIEVELTYNNCSGV